MEPYLIIYSTVDIKLNLVLDNNVNFFYSIDRLTFVFDKEKQI